MKVCKFGGTSMANAETINKVKDIILADDTRKFIVVSAPGKRDKSDTKVTDLLYQAYDEQQIKGNCKETLDKVRGRFESLCKDLNLDLDINPYIDEIEKRMPTSKSADYAASRGEYLAGLVMAKVLNFKFVDAAEIIKFNSEGVFENELTNDLIKRLKDEKGGVVIPGFYGRMPDKSIKTFTRGGSDFTGALIARGVNASLYENWTDVNGFSVSDPRIVKNAKSMASLTYEELRELSYMGASVLHPDSIFPVKVEGIPIQIKNTFEPDNVGTIITKGLQNNDKPIVTGIAGRKSNTSVLLKKPMMNNEVGFARKVLSVFERRGISIEHLPTGIDTMSIVFSKALSKEEECQLVEDLKIAVNPSHVEIEKDLALIAIVGHGMASTKGTAAKVFTALANNDINVRLIDQGSSELNIIVGVEDSDFENAINSIYRAFYN